MTETTRTLITDEDVRHLIGGCDFITAGAEDLAIKPESLRWALKTTAARLRARWVAEALEAATNELISFTDEAQDAAQDSLDRARMVGLNDAGLILRAVAAEYRGGKR